MWNISDVSTFKFPYPPWDIDFIQQDIIAHEQKRTEITIKDNNIGEDIHSLPTIKSQFLNSEWAKALMGMKTSRRKVVLKKSAYNTSGVFSVYNALLPYELEEISEKFKK